MSEAADSQDGYGISGLSAAVAKGVESSDACAQQWRRIGRQDFRRDRRQSLKWREHVLGVAAIVGDPGNLQRRAVDEISTAA